MYLKSTQKYFYKKVLKYSTSTGFPKCTGVQYNYWKLCLVQVLKYLHLSTYSSDGITCDAFDVKVEVHQGSVLSPLLFILVMEAPSRNFKVGLPW